MFLSRHVKFVETDFPYSLLVTTSSQFDSLHPSKFTMSLTSFEDVVIGVPVSLFPHACTGITNPPAVRSSSFSSSISGLPNTSHVSTFPNSPRSNFHDELPQCFFPVANDLHPSPPPSASPFLVALSSIL